jgi:hypothetical protein
MSIVGYINEIALSAQKVEAEEDLRNLEVNVRNCYFEDETNVLKYFKNYTQSNCMMECSLEYGRYNSSNEIPCLPWNFPTPSDSITICDPWETTNFLQNYIVDAELCNYCLADCSITLYTHTLSRIPLASCDYANMGVSYFCNYSPMMPPQPSIIADQLRKEYANRNPLPDYISNLESGVNFINILLAVFLFKSPRSD